MQEPPGGFTEEWAISFYGSGAWQDLTERELTELVLRSDRAIAPFDVIHRAFGVALGRSVFNHEFGLNWEGLKAEFFEDGPAPTLDQIIGMLPADKTIIVVAPDGDAE